MASDDFICGICYLISVGTLYAIFGILTIIGVGIGSWRDGRAFLRRSLKIVVFLCCLLLIGDVFGCIWGNTIWGWLYRSTDYCGIDFLPFFPITQGLLNAPFGNEPHGLLNGATLTQINLVWFPFATATWSITFVLYRTIIWIAAHEYSTRIAPYRASLVDRAPADHLSSRI